MRCLERLAQDDKKLSAPYAELYHNVTINSLARTLLEGMNIKNAKKIQAVILCAVLSASCGQSSGWTSSTGGGVKDSEPYTKFIGNGVSKDYAFHNFMGEKPDIIPSTAKVDVNRYFERGAAYIQTQFGDFYGSLSGRADVQRYFAQFNLNFNSELEEHFRRRHKREISDCEKMDFYVNKISEVCGLVLTDIMTNLTSPIEREAFVLCYRLLANEAYKEALGEKRKTDNAMTQKYQQERSAISELWQKNSFLRSVPLDNYTDYNSRRLVDRLYTLLYKAAQRMRETSSLRDFSIKEKDLQNAVNLALNASALAAMHDSVAELLQHNECRMERLKL